MHGLAFGGQDPYGAVACTEEYDGSTWTAGGALITARDSLAGAGTQNAGLAFGGSPGLSCTEEYDGTSWTACGTLITARRTISRSRNTKCWTCFWWYNTFITVVSCTEEYDGTSWSAGGALITVSNRLAGAGTQNAGLAFGGTIPGALVYHLVPKNIMEHHGPQVALL
jgi:hypothetical protein